MIDYKSQPNGQAWCFIFQYPDKKPAMFGTVYTPKDAHQHEVEAACQVQWAEVFPFACPPIVNLVRGQLVFMEDKT